MNERYLSSDSDLPPEVLEALSRGRKIEAIKLLRDARHMDLKSAKEAVEYYERTHAVPKREDVSGMITEDRTNTKLLVLIVIAAAAAAVYFFFFQ